jgi:hypothetical protein
MEKQAQSAEGTGGGLAGFPFFNWPAMRMAVWPMEIWLQWQAELLKVAGPATADWMTRRREGTESALRALERLCACQDPNDASKIQSEWIAEESKRLESDMRALSSPTLFPPRVAAQASRHAAQTKRAPR